MDIIKHASQKIQELFPEAKGIYLFGSFATGTQTSTSDIDLAILTKEKTNKLALWNAAQAIAQELKRDVDLIDLAQASTVFAFEIINNGKRIFSKDEKACDLFENKAISMYLRFQEERKPILDEIKTRGGKIL